jgi:carboxyl-terminal processing protease
VGVISDIVVPGPLSEVEIGEKFSKNPLQNDSIPASFDDNLDDIPYLQRDKIKSLYKFDLQKRLQTYEKYLPLLKKNSAVRIENNKDYQHLLKEMRKKEDAEIEEENNEQLGQGDLQLNETNNIMKDLLFLMH